MCQPDRHEIYKAASPIGVADVRPLMQEVGEGCTDLLRRLDHRGYVDMGFAVGQLRLTQPGLLRAEKLVH